MRQFLEKNKTMCTAKYDVQLTTNTNAQISVSMFTPVTFFVFVLRTPATMQTGVKHTL
jgi:hypothetical protein